MRWLFLGQVRASVSHVFVATHRTWNVNRENLRKRIDWGVGKVAIVGASCSAERVRIDDDDGDSIRNTFVRRKGCENFRVRSIEIDKFVPIWTFFWTLNLVESGRKRKCYDVYQEPVVSAVLQVQFSQH